MCIRDREQGTQLSGFPGAEVTIGTSSTDDTDPISSKVEIRGVDVRIQTNAGAGFPTPGKLSFFDASPVNQPAAITPAVPAVTSPGAAYDQATAVGVYTAANEAVTAVNEVIKQLQVLGLISA